MWEVIWGSGRGMGKGRQCGGEERETIWERGGNGVEEQ